MSSDPTPAIPLGYATESDTSLARAVAVCHWVAIGVLAIQAFNEAVPIVESYVPLPQPISWYSYDFTNLGVWQRGRYMTPAMTSCLSLISAIGALRRRRAAWRAWAAMLALSICCAGGLSIYYNFLYVPEATGSILIPSPLGSKIGNVLTATFLRPDFLLLVLFTRPPIVRARWVR